MRGSSPSTGPSSPRPRAGSWENATYSRESVDSRLARDPVMGAAGKEELQMASVTQREAQQVEQANASGRTRAAGSHNYDGIHTKYRSFNLVVDEVVLPDRRAPRATRRWRPPESALRPGPAAVPAAPAELGRGLPRPSRPHRRSGGAPCRMVAGGHQPPPAHATETSHDRTSPQGSFRGPGGPPRTRRAPSQARRHPISAREHTAVNPALTLEDPTTHHRRPLTRALGGLVGPRPSGHSAPAVAAPLLVTMAPLRRAK
jgi:hypothetical protein